MDFTDIPYYGARNNPHIVGGKKKGGTNYHFRYLATDLVDHGYRFPSIFRPMAALDNPRVPDIVLAQLQTVWEQLPFDLLLLDRGFFDSKILTRLNQQAYPFLLPVVKNEKILDLVRQKWQALPPTQRCRGIRIPGYSLGAANAKIDLLVIEGRLRTKDRKQLLIFATNTSLSPRRALHLYRRLWGIETAFRQIHSLRATTSSPDPRYRTLLFGAACLLLALWVWLNLALCKGGGDIRLKTPVSVIWMSRRTFRIVLRVYEFCYHLLQHLRVISFQAGDS